ncbi:MAG: JAB domain-containing protein [Dehalococcoidales bacterium]|nr:JAB domain-containing protein [Dehalococcoidales bacterium]
MGNTADISQRLREALLLLESGSQQEPNDEQPMRRQVKGTDEAWEFFKEMRHLEQEELWVIALNNSLEVLDLVKLYRGNASSAIVRPAEVFREAVRLGATSVAMAHNHPAGDPRPSAEDLEITRVVAAAGKILDIPLLDHLVIARQSYTSIIGQHLVDITGQNKAQKTASTQKRPWTQRIEL